MIQAFKEFMKGILSLSLGWQLWVGLMWVLNMVAPIMFLKHIEAQITLVAMMAGGMTGIALVKVQGFTKLLGVMHIYWVPLVLYLLQQVETLSPSDLFCKWMWSVIVVNSISLIIDAADVITYFRQKKSAI